ncbi:MAG TPA: SRPBCC family protein, partial [Streptosporangiaceae bacterium]|nr:SRPBCC family protein [Streptosporangiaceae bacterium]
MAIELDNSFTVPVPPEQAWDVLLDVERIAPCMPGASVTSVEGDEIDGQVKVKLGPLSLTYKGTAKFTDKDQATHTISIEATGKETRGSGTASATVQANLTPGGSAGQTLVSIHTSLNVTGKPAQFGRSLLPEVSGKLIQQFATNLEAMINADGAVAAGTAAPAADDAGADKADATEAGEAAAQAGHASAGSAQTAPAAAAPAAPVVRQEESLNAF